MIPPWDMELFKELYIGNRSYEDVVDNIARKLQNAVEQGRIRRHLHIAVLVPNLSPSRVNRVLDKLAVYEGTRRFMNYLSKTENVISERLRELEETLIKRKDLLTLLDGEVRGRHLRRLRSKLEHEIVEAKTVAQKQLVRLSREIVADILGLCHKTVYYSIDRDSFTAKDIMSGETKDSQRDERAIDLTNYAPIVNKFLVDAIHGLAYEYNAMKITRAVLDAYRKEFEHGIIRESDRIDEIVENIMLGTYGVKPLSTRVALEAVKHLNNQTIDLDDKTIEISIDFGAGLIRFNVKSKKKEEPTPIVTIGGVEVQHLRSIGATAGLTELPTPEQTLQSVSLELPPGFNVDDIRQRLVAFLNLLDGLKVKATSIVVKLESANFTLGLTLKEPSRESLNDTAVKTIMNMISRLSGRDNKPVYMDILLSDPIAEDNVKSMFGDYFKPQRLI